MAQVAVPAQSPGFGFPDPTKPLRCLDAPSLSSGSSQVGGLGEDLWLPSSPGYFTGLVNAKIGMAADNSPTRSLFCVVNAVPTDGGECRRESGVDKAGGSAGRETCAWRERKYWT